MSGQDSRRQFPKAFKQETLKLIRTSGKTTVEIARDLGLRPELIYRWKSESKTEGTQAFPGTGHLKDGEAEDIRRLKQELEYIKEERNILKKAFAIFSKVSQ